MKNYKDLGKLVGALISPIPTAICLYFTGSIWSSIIPYACNLLGGWIGESIVKSK